MQKATDEDRIALGQLTTRDESGRHFTELYSDDWLNRMESLGYITIHIPKHTDGTPYSQLYWSVVVSEEVSAWFDDQGNLA